MTVLQHLISLPQRPLQGKAWRIRVQYSLYGKRDKSSQGVYRIEYLNEENLTVNRDCEVVILYIMANAF